MLFDIPFIADWQKIGEHRQQLTDLDNAQENKGRIDYDYKVGQKVLLRKEGILCNAESRYHKKPWLIASVHTNGTITVQRGNKIDRMNIQRVKPFEEDLDNKEGCDFASAYTCTQKLQKNIKEQFPLDDVFCIFVVFLVVLLAHGQHKCANVQMCK
jgi:hypothetical protein